MENVLAVIGIIIGVINIAVLLVYVSKVSKLKKMYDTTLAKFNNTANVKDKFVELFARLDEVEQKCVDTKDYCKSIDKSMNVAIRKTGLVKYNAYDKSDNKLSFALCMLNKDNNGVLLNNVHSIHGSNMYIKKVVDGKIEERISEEEAQALKEATGNEASRNVYDKKNELIDIKKINTRKKTRIVR